MADKQPKGQRVPGTNTYDVQEPPPKKAYNPEDELGSGILIDGKRMKATPPPAPASSPAKPNPKPMKKMAKGGCVKMAKGGSVSSRADGCAQRGKTRGEFV